MARSAGAGRDVPSVSRAKTIRRIIRLSKSQSGRYRKLEAGICVVLIAFSMLQMVQYWMGMIPIEGPDWDTNRRSFRMFTSPVE